jgi:hypothetical protein
VLKLAIELLVKYKIKTQQLYCLGWQELSTLQFPHQKDANEGENNDILHLPVQDNSL